MHCLAYLQGKVCSLQTFTKTNAGVSLKMSHCFLLEIIDFFTDTLDKFDCCCFVDNYIFVVVLFIIVVSVGHCLLVSS